MSMSTAYNLANRFVKIDTYENGERDWDGLADFLVQASFLAVSYEMTKDMLKLTFSDQSELIVDNPHQHRSVAMVTVYEHGNYVISY